MAYTKAVPTRIGGGENSHLAKADKRQAGATSSGLSWPGGEFGFFLSGLASFAAGGGSGLGGGVAKQVHSPLRGGGIWQEIITLGPCIPSSQPSYL